MLSHLHPILLDNLLPFVLSQHKQKKLFKKPDGKSIWEAQRHHSHAKRKILYYIFGH